MNIRDYTKQMEDLFKETDNYYERYSRVNYVKRPFRFNKEDEIDETQKEYLEKRTKEVEDEFKKNPFS